MSHSTFIVLDLETTGLDSQLEGIIEMAAVRLDHGVETAHFHRLVNPGIEISPASQAIHGITEAMIADAPSVSSVLPEFLAFAGNYPLVAHNAPFDIGFLNRALGLAGREPLGNPVFDSLEIAKEVLPEQRSHKLEAVCKALGHEAQGFHRALDDARHLALVFPRLLERYHQKQAWYRSQFARIAQVAQRYDQLGKLIEDLQAEQTEARRVLHHYFNDHPEAKVLLPGGESLARATKESWDYDPATLMPLLEAWGLKDRMLKLDRPRLDRWLTGDRLTDEQKAQVTGTRMLLGVTHRITRLSAPQPEPAAQAEPPPLPEV
jgi:DNA polymerase III epsilon subunit family exonuclease